MPLYGSLPVKFLTASCTAGIRVEPPTKITLSIWFLSSFASARALTVQSIVSFTRSSVSWSNLARVSSYSICLGPVASAEINGSEIVVFGVAERSILAFSAASFNLCIASLSCVRSILFVFLNSSTRRSIILLSKSSPPKRVLPFVERTSNTPSPISRIETSNVPPPRSYTSIF